MPIMVITWHAQPDTEPKHICGYLDGKIWTFNTKTDRFPRVLSYGGYGDVWDLSTNTPLTHGHGPWNCRCRLDFSFGVEDLNSKVSGLLVKVENAAQERRKIVRVSR